ncbi:hypothetical protein M2322_004608 [Rhodoblastus acidophilus]|nr:hypothetical protein [Rhodoblastus acidophilus]
MEGNLALFAFQPDENGPRRFAAFDLETLHWRDEALPC